MILKSLNISKIKKTAANSVLAIEGVNIVFENSVNIIRKMLFIFLFLVI